MSCKWRTGVSFKAIYKGNKGDVREENKIWILTVILSEHTHAIALNPLTYTVHRKRRPKYQKAMKLARTHRETFLKYGASNRVIKTAGVKLDRKSYYNIKINFQTSK
jgi:hypothetical protein